jgi:hypothetical protein
VKEQPKAPSREEPRARDDVSVNRCPFCHDGICIDAEAWVACARCLARHHGGCFAEGARCGACGHDAPLVAPPAGRTRRVVAVALALLLALLLTLAARDGASFTTQRTGPRLAGGDMLEVDDVRAPRAPLEHGDLVVVQGRYALRSRERAVLAFEVGGHRVSQYQVSAMREGGGEGGFSFQERISDPAADLRVILIDVDTGASLGGITFTVE